MSDRKITQLAQLNSANAAANDLVVVVDVSDTSMAPSGTTKSMQLSEQAAFFAAAPGQIVGQTDIGTAPNQIPLNQYLGQYAYMDTEGFVVRPQASANPGAAGGA